MCFCCSLCVFTIIFVCFALLFSFASCFAIVGRLFDGSFCALLLIHAYVRLRLQLAARIGSELLERNEEVCVYVCVCARLRMYVCVSLAHTNVGTGVNTNGRAHSASAATRSRSREVEVCCVLCVVCDFVYFCANLCNV